MAPKILVVDDSETVRTILCDALEDDGYDVSAAASGREALAAVRDSRPDVMLLDVEMPGMSGIDVLLTLKSRVETRDISVIMVTAHDRDDKVVGALEVGATDFIPKSLSEAVVRARVRNVIRIRSRHRRVEAATEAKAQFLANMSHEIRTPMTAILGFADLLASEDHIENMREDRAAAIQAIRRNGEYLLELINDILDLSKVEAGKLKVERIRCSAIQVMTDVVSMMRVKADAKGLPLEVEFNGPIPETLHTDPTRLRQILINVLSNAVKFTSTGCVRIALSLVHNDRGEPALQIEVADTGIGMSAKQLAEVFKPFSQAETYTTRKYGGTGLGLTISKHLAELLEGTISVRSDPELGSTFTITVATGSLEEVVLLENLTEAQFTAQREQRKAALDQKTLHCRVLLAEDGPDNQRLFSFVLRNAGAEVTVAENGQVAIDFVSTAQKKNEPYDVILMDMQMPVMDGFSATKKLRAEGYAGPIVALTARAMQGDREACLDSGCDDYMTKPIKREELLALVAKHVGRTCKEASLDSKESETPVNEELVQE